MDNNIIDLRLETEQESRNFSGTYSWIKCNRNFQGFFITDYSFPTTAWSDFSNILETNPTVTNNKISKFEFPIFILVLLRRR